MTKNEIEHMWEVASNNPNHDTNWHDLIAQHERERFTDAAMKSAEKAVDVAMALEREACAKLVDHILKEGGGTYGDAIRARSQT